MKWLRPFRVAWALSFWQLRGRLRARFLSEPEVRYANVSGYPVGSMNVPVSGAPLPGWNAYNIFNTQTGQVSVVSHDEISGGGAVISVIDASAGFGFNPIQGTYSALLFSGGPNMSSISQSGTVPSGTESLEADISWSGVAPIVAVNGQVISMVPLAVFSNYTVYGGDISSFAGLPATLAFTEPAPASSSPAGRRWTFSSPRSLFPSRALSACSAWARWWQDGGLGGNTP